MPSQTPEAPENKEPELCPNCNAEVTFSEKDGDIEFWDCPNCGQINLKKETWKKMMLTPSTLPEVHVNCNFCKNKHSTKCPDSPNPDTCPMYDENKNISHAEKILMLIDQEQPNFFKDQYGNFYALINDNNAQQTLNIHSEEFKRLCRDRFFRTFGKVPNNDSVKDAIKAFEAISRNSKVYSLRPRVNLIKNEHKETEIWIDTGNPFWTAIKITQTQKGYDIQQKTPPLFKRYKHMKELPLPKVYDGGDDSDDILRQFRTPISAVVSKKRKGRGVKVCILYRQNRHSRHRNKNTLTLWQQTTL